ncbi:hypothetical protein AB0K16_23895 [Nonomuraea jabiensis]|uniref:hypothetical protein n=1 Tax=Nonomuraea jabiensis TaxID=882448 RepID=UPI0034331A8B
MARRSASAVRATVTMPASSASVRAGSRAAGSASARAGSRAAGSAPGRAGSRVASSASVRTGSRAAGSALMVIRRGHHRGRAIVTKLDARNRLDAVRIAAEAGWL